MDDQLHSARQVFAGKSSLHLPFSPTVELGLFEKRAVSGTPAGGATAPVAGGDAAYRLCFLARRFMGSCSRSSG